MRPLSRTDRRLLVVSGFRCVVRHDRGSCNDGATRDFEASNSNISVDQYTLSLQLSANLAIISSFDDGVTCEYSYLLTELSFGFKYVHIAIKNLIVLFLVIDRPELTDCFKCVVLFERN